MAFSLLNPIVGTQPITYGSLPDTTARMKTGSIVSAYDPYWGGAEFVYARATSTIAQFALCVMTPALVSGVYIHTAVAVANTANLGRSVYVACTAMTTGQYGWFQATGLVPINGTADVAAATAFGITAAGQIGANTAGKQILNGIVILPSTTTVAKTNVSTIVGSTQLQVGDSNGWFYGAYLSGTGIAATTTVTDISPDGRTVTISLATTAATGTVTATYNNATVYYNLCYIDRPFAQGAIT